MATLKELADAEADAAEAELGTDDPDELDDEQEEHDEAEPVAAPAPVVDEAAMEAVGKKLDSESTRHAKAVEKIMGPDFGDVHPCPMCWLPGYVPLPTPGDALERRRADVMEYFDAAGRPLKARAGAVACPDCDGWGVLSTPSHVQGQGELPCARCSAQGWVDETSLQVSTPAYPPANGVPVPGTEWQAPVPAAVLDPWGRPPTAPNYGVDPATNGGVW